MEQSYETSGQNPLSPKMLEWLRLCRALYDRITDPELRMLLHQFITVDQDLCREECQEAYERGLADGKNM